MSILGSICRLSPSPRLQVQSQAPGIRTQVSSGDHVLPTPHPCRFPAHTGTRGLCPTPSVSHSRRERRGSLVSFEAVSHYN